jgi:hypothetical protein
VLLILLELEENEFSPVPPGVDEVLNLSFILNWYGNSCVRSWAFSLLTFELLIPKFGSLCHPKVMVFTHESKTR